MSTLIISASSKRRDKGVDRKLLSYELPSSPLLAETPWKRHACSWPSSGTSRLTEWDHMAPPWPCPVPTPVPGVCDGGRKTCLQSNHRGLSLRNQLLQQSQIVPAEFKMRVRLRNRKWDENRTISRKDTNSPKVWWLLLILWADLYLTMSRGAEPRTASSNELDEEISPPLPFSHTAGQVPAQDKYEDSGWVMLKVRPLSKPGHYNQLDSYSKDRFNIEQPNSQ